MQELRSRGILREAPTEEAKQVVPTWTSKVAIADEWVDPEVRLLLLWPSSGTCLTACSRERVTRNHSSPANAWTTVSTSRTAAG